LNACSADTARAGPFFGTNLASTIFSSGNTAATADSCCILKRRRQTVAVIHSRTNTRRMMSEPTLNSTALFHNSVLAWRQHFKAARAESTDEARPTVVNHSRGNRQPRRKQRPQARAAASAR
jgi:hypothetical protein